MTLTEYKNGLPHGIRILDLADEEASFCSKLMADLGAYVIKVERPGGDPSRKIEPFWGNSPHPERSFFYCFFGAENPARRHQTPGNMFRLKFLER